MLLFVYMKNLFNKFSLGLLGFLATTESVFAQEPVGGTTNTEALSSPVTLNNPISVDSIPELVTKILDIVLTVGVPLIALAIIYSGYLFVAAQGNSTKLEEAKRSIVYVVIGAAILLAAHAISVAIFSSVQSIRG